MGMTSMKVRSMPRDAHHSASANSSSSLKPARATVLIFTCRPAAWAASMPRRTCGSRPQRVTRANFASSSVSRDTLIRRTPAAARGAAKRSSCEPLVVRVISSSAPEARWRDMPSKKPMMPRRTRGSPPVMRSLRTPRRTKALHRRSSSSRVRSSFLGRNCMFSAMQ